MKGQDFDNKMYISELVTDVGSLYTDLKTDDELFALSVHQSKDNFRINTFKVRTKCMYIMNKYALV